MFTSSLPGVPQAAGRNYNNRSSQSPHGIKRGALSSRPRPANVERCLGQHSPRLPCHSLTGHSRSVLAQAQKGQPDPPDAPREERRGGREWLQTLLSRFGPITQKAENTAVLDFEKPLVELDNRIKEVMSSAQVFSLIVQWLDFTDCNAAGSQSRRGERCRRFGVDKGTGGKG